MIPDELYTEIRNGDCVVFAGAGISTEGGMYGGRKNLYQTILEKSEHPENRPRPSFQDLMQYYCDERDGGRKHRLIREIISRIEAFSQADETHHATTLFHKELARIPQVKVVITTNWDTFFERYLNVLVPIVENRDLPFWNDQRRQVIKVHGCVTRPYTIIATANDYATLLEQEERRLVLNKVRDLMATKTFLFAGYSMRDPHMHTIYDTILDGLGDFARPAYAIDPEPPEETIGQWRARGVHIVKSKRFLPELIRRLIEDGDIPDPEVERRFSDERSRIVEVHLATAGKESGAAFASSMYQDGVIHEIDEIASRCRYGTTVADLERKLAQYSGDVDEYIEAENLVEVAYWMGRYETLRRFIDGDVDELPLFLDHRTLEPAYRMKDPDADPDA